MLQYSGIILIGWFVHLGGFLVDKSVLPVMVCDMLPISYLISQHLVNFQQPGQPRPQPSIKRSTAFTSLSASDRSLSASLLLDHSQHFDMTNTLRQELQSSSVLSSGIVEGFGFSFHRVEQSIELSKSPGEPYSEQVVVTSTEIRTIAQEGNLGMSKSTD